MRITVYDTKPTTSKRSMVGWFDIDRAQHFHPEISMSCNDFGDPESTPATAQSLYRTSLGRWVLCTELQDAPPHYRFLPPAQARSWLHRNGLPEAAARFLQPRRPKRRPRKAGRPEVGGPVTVRLGEDLLTAVDDYAGTQNTSRADAIRDLIKSALAGTALHAPTDAPAKGSGDSGGQWQTGFD